MPYSYPYTTSCRLDSELVEFVDLPRLKDNRQTPSHSLANHLELARLSHSTPPDLPFVTLCSFVHFNTTHNNHRQFLKLSVRWFATWDAGPLYATLGRKELVRIQHARPSLASSGIEERMIIMSLGEEHDGVSSCCAHLVVPFCICCLVVVVFFFLRRLARPSLSF